MEINEYLKDQKQIFWDLLAATVWFNGERVMY